MYREEVLGETNEEISLEEVHASIARLKSKKVSGVGGNR